MVYPALEGFPKLDGKRSSEEGQRRPPQAWGTWAGAACSQTRLWSLVSHPPPCRCLLVLLDELNCQYACVPGRPQGGLLSKDSSRHSVEAPLSPYHAPVLSTKADFPLQPAEPVAALKAWRRHTTSEMPSWVTLGLVCRAPTPATRPLW